MTDAHPDAVVHETTSIGGRKPDFKHMDRWFATTNRLRTEGTDHLLGAGGAVLRYGALYGPGATDDQLELVRKRQFPVVGAGTGHSWWVHVDDAASATVLAVERRATGLFNVVDDEPAPSSEWLPHLAACAGVTPPWRVPTWLARLLAGDVAVAMMTEGRGFSNAKAKRELGWEPRYPSWRQGFEEGPH